MNYKTAICACAALINTAPAWAQEAGPSTVTLYGAIEQGGQYLSHAATGKTTGDAFQVGSGMATSFFGLRGTENLGNGLQAIWNLEGGFSPQNGGKLAYAASTMLPVEDPPTGGSQIPVIAGIQHRF